ncbi:MAG: PHP domain-containing protein [Anaerolineaceae bacterium]|nr:PHP domain-containing protein [Anaerolineaceae bacterium]
MRTYRADLHVHTVLSPCAQIEMIPPLIVREALEFGIQLIAITDHNTTKNIAAVQKAAAGTELVVLPGMELQTREEVHVLCLFDTLEQTQDFQKEVDIALPVIPNRPDYFGEQFVVDETGDFIESEDRLLLTSTKLSLRQAWEKVEQLGGLFIPAHVNRKTFGLLENLGLVPDDFPILTLEISRHITPAKAVVEFPQLKGYPLIQNGDVHGLDEFLGSNEYFLANATTEELRKAIQGKENRSFTYNI